MRASLANGLWLAGCLPEYWRLRRATARVAKEQEVILGRILRDNATTEFGRVHSFERITSAAEFQKRVPIRDYDGHAPWMERAAAGTPNVLTRDPVRVFEPTSGSSGFTGATKLIPYTASLANEFQRGIQAWIGDVFLHRRDLMNGPAYWSVSPVGGTPKTTAGGIPIGFEDDSAYVGGWRRPLVQSVMAVPGSVRHITDIDEWRYATRLHLVRARGLRLISVWNPTFLSLLVDTLHEDAERLVYDLAHTGTDRRRVEEVRAAMRATSPEERFARLWPKLGLISCWTDANAAGPGARLAAAFPGCTIQGKGLIATEAMVSVPVFGGSHPMLAVRSHFFEFLAEGDSTPRLAHELEQGGLYSVIVTTGGGFYRYPLGDQVEAMGFRGACPLLRFVGRTGSVSDWFGEKLDDAHVSRVLRQIGMQVKFAMLACDTRTPAAYVLYVDGMAESADGKQLASELDSGLRENGQYDYARRLGQLGAARIERVSHAEDRYFARMRSLGMRLGNIKIPALDRRDGWGEVFARS